jgi:ATP-dependent Lon protease
MKSAQDGCLWDALLPFLDRGTAARYRDQSLDSQLDLSHVSYITVVIAVVRLDPPL